MNQSLEQFSTFLTSNGIDTTKYWIGEAKSLSNLLEEITSWEAELTLHPELLQLIRRVKVLNIEVLFGEKRLRERKQVFKDETWRETDRIRRRTHLKVAVSEKVKRDEKFVPAVIRAIREELGGIIIREKQIWPQTEETVIQSSPSFPWISTEYTVIKTTLRLESSQFKPQGYIERQKDKNTYFEWEDNEREGFTFPKIHQIIYVPSQTYISHGRDDFSGWKAVIVEIKNDEDGLSVRVWENPNAFYDWENLLRNQKERQEQYGETIAHPDPDYSPEMNGW